MADSLHLLARLDAIGRSLRDSGRAMALIGLGSVGLDTARLDAWSDLDFFAIVQPGSKSRYLHQLDWLAAAHPLAWHFQNTADGHKALMADGVFCEFAVFEPDELAGIPYAPGRVVWRRHDAPGDWGQPRQALPSATPPDETWIVGEALSCLFVGLQRWHRGEKLSAARFVQSHALDRLMELDALRQAQAGAGGAPAGPDGAAAAASSRDPFNPDRRLEARCPALATELPALVPGYAHTPQAARAMLAALRRRGACLDAAMTDRIEALAG